MYKMTTTWYTRRDWADW